MEMHQVRYFLAVARLLNFTRAAEACNVAQPSLTRAISMLEAEFGGDLFRRERRNTHLTQLGDRMLPILRQCYESAQSAKALASSVKTGGKVSLTIAIGDTVDIAIIVPQIQELARGIKGLEFALMRGPQEKIAEDLKSGAAEVAVYVLSGTTQTGLTLTANPHYWAGKPAIDTIELVDDLGGRSQVDAFQSNELDYAPLNGADASWIAYDRTLGPQLRQVGSLSVQYYGFDTSRPPFDDVRVRRAIGEAVDWRRLAALAGSDGSVEVANSMVPPGIPGRSDADFVPTYDPAAARQLLAEAGYPGGAGFPATTLMTGGGPFDEAIVDDGEARTRDQPVVRDDGRRLLRSPGHGPATDVDARLGRGLSRAATTSWASCSGRARRRTTDAGARPRSMRRSPRPARRPIRHAVSAAFDKAEAVVRDDVPVVPRRLRSGLGAVADRPPGRDPERARDRADGGAGMGRLIRRTARPALRRGRAARRRRPEPDACRLGRDLGDLRDADGQVHLRDRHRVQPARDGRQATGPGRDPADGGRRDRADRRRGAGSERHRTDDAGPPPGHDGRQPPAAEHADRRTLAPDRSRRPDRRGARACPAGHYADDRFTWQTEAGSLVRVHWYEGTADFGRRALKIGEDGVRKASDLLGVTESKPVDFYVYADQKAFYDALGPGTRENVGGEADAGIRTLFALIPPSQINDAWVGIVIPHELTHLVFDTAAGNPYHFPPRWLNEGLAVYESQGYDASDRDLVSGAVSSDTLIPLDGLVGQFPTSADGFYLAYAESVSAVDFMVRTYGSDALVKLIRSYKDGRTDDEAFQEGLGVGTAAFAAAWLADLGAKAPTRYGPQPAPPGPVPSAWLAEGGVAAPSPSAAAPSAGPTSPAPTGGGGADATLPILALLAIVARDRDRRSRSGSGAVGAGRAGERRRDTALGPHATELAGHPGSGPAGARFPDRRPACRPRARASGTRPRNGRRCSRPPASCRRSRTT